MNNATDDLMNSAVGARAVAYAPYSGYKVGAALLTKSGRIFSGANVENISFGLTICAERVCVGAAVAAGERQFERLVIVADSAEPAVPCGACRQVLAEFCPDLPITSATMAGRQQDFALSELLPSPGQGIDVPRRT